MKIKKILITIVLVLSFLLLCSIKVEATLELEQLDFEAQINEDGSMNVTETWNMYISEINTVYKTFEKNKDKYSEITDIKVTEITNGSYKEFIQTNEESYHVEKDYYYALDNSNGMFEIAWGVGLDDDSDNRQYKISYKVTDVIAKYNDYAELYWQFIGEDFEIDAQKVKGVITLPYNVNSKEELKVWGHTEDLNGEIYATDLNKIEFVITDYNGGRYVEVRSLMPNDMISSTGRVYNENILDRLLKEETKWAEEANERREKRQNVIKGVAIVVAVVAVFFVYKIFRNISKLRKLEMKIKPTEKLEYYRELPYEDATPAEAIFVMTSAADKSFASSFSANILDLCLNKYVSLEVIKGEGVFKSDEVKITLLDKDESTLKPDIKLTLDFLKEVAKEEKQVTTKQITKYLEKHLSKVEKLDEKMEKIIETEETKKGNYNDKNFDKSNKYVGFTVAYAILAFCVIGIIAYFVEMRSENFIPTALALMIAFVVNAIILGMMAYRVNVFSQKGIDEKEKWKAFKKYMEEFSLLKDKEIPSLVLWEKYLVFATAFGISEKVLKQLKVVYPEIMDMNSAMYSYSYIHVMNSVNIGDCINNSVYSAVGSSGSGAGGGFSGGGGGGRWPEVAEADAKK